MDSQTWLYFRIETKSVRKSQKKLSLAFSVSGLKNNNTIILKNTFSGWILPQLMDKCEFISFFLIRLDSVRDEHWACLLNMNQNPSQKPCQVC